MPQFRYDSTRELGPSSVSFQAPLIGIDIGAMWTKFSMVFCWLAASTVNWDTREDFEKAKGRMVPTIYQSACQIRLGRCKTGKRLLGGRGLAEMRAEMSLGGGVVLLNQAARLQFSVTVDDGRNISRNFQKSGMIGSRAPSEIEVPRDTRKAEPLTVQERATAMQQVVRRCAAPSCFN